MHKNAYSLNASLNKLDQSEQTDAFKQNRKRQLNDDDVAKMLNRYAEKRQTGISLKSLLEFGAEPSEKTLLSAASFLHHELPIRLAKRAVELENLPYGLSHMPAIREVRSWYLMSLKQLLNSKRIETFEDERKFTNTVKEIYERHSGTLWTMAKGLFQLKKSMHYEKLTRFSLHETFPEIQIFLDKFFLSRVGVRVLIGQHIALHEHIENWTGLICRKTDPIEIARSASKSATRACQNFYGFAPQVLLTHNFNDLRKSKAFYSSAESALEFTKTNIETDYDKSEVEFAHMPAMLHHKLFELLKNAMRATIEKMHLTGAVVPEPILLHISKDIFCDDISFSVKDTGLGISESDLKNIFSYMFTTAKPEEVTILFKELSNTGTTRDFDENANGLPLAGLGYGLSITRVFAQYFGSTVTVTSRNLGRGEDCGTEVVIRVKALGDSQEPLP